jgi:FG-GAP-like repeat
MANARNAQYGLFYLLFVVCPIAFAHGEGRPIFLASPGYAAAPYVDPSGVSVADLNRDGLADVLVSGHPPGHTNSTPLVILRANAIAGFESPQFIHVAENSDGPIATGDLNADGWQDVVQLAFKQSPTLITVFLNDQHGDLQLASQFTVPGIFPSAALADVNGDKLPDLIVSTQAPLAIYVLRNAGGNFEPPIQVATPSPGPQRFSAIDMNADGRAEIVYIGYYIQDLPNSRSQLRIVSFQPNGSYSDVIPPGTDAVSGAVSAVDLNADGFSDLVIQSGFVAYPTVVKVYLSDGQGGFALRSEYTISPSGYDYYRLVVGDFDNDGHMDLAGVNGEPAPSHLLYLWGDGSGGLVPQRVNGPMGFYTATGDVNGDGIPDVVIPDRSYNLSVSPGRNDRNFGSPLSLVAWFAGTPSTADIDGDGRADLLVTGEPDFRVPGTVMLSKGNGSFEYAAAVSPDALVISDLNGDSHAELIGTVPAPFVGGGTARLQIWPGTGEATFSVDPVELVLPFDLVDLKIADIDRNGWPDLIAVGTSTGMVLFGRGNFAFSPVASSFHSPIAIGDFNSDGYPDIASDSATFFGSFNRTLRSVRTNLVVSRLQPKQIATGDFNGDSRTDIAEMLGSLIRLEYACGDALFCEGDLQSMTDVGGAIAVADFNGDGFQDLAIALTFTHQMALFASDAQGGFLQSYYASGVTGIAMIADDLNQDGSADVLITSYGLLFRPFNLSLMLNSGKGQLNQ